MIKAEVGERLRAVGGRLTTAERRVGNVVVDRPQLVGFGTVAELALAAEVGAATVVRFAVKLGYDGYSDLQAAVQAELSRQLGPAAERIQGSGAPSAADHRSVEESNVRTTLDAADPDEVEGVVQLLADLSSHVWVLAGEAERGVALQFADDLRALRPRVSMLRGSDVAVRRALALAELPAVVVAIDLRRYEAWVVDAARQASAAGMTVVALTDGPLSPLADIAKHAFGVAAASPSPFDSHVGTLALLNVFVGAAADRLRASAAGRLAAVEAAWADALTDR